MRRLAGAADAGARRLAERNGHQAAASLRQSVLARQGPERHGDVARPARPVRLRHQRRCRSSGAGRLHRRSAGAALGSARRSRDAAGTHRPADRGAWSGGGGVHRDDVARLDRRPLERRRLQRPRPRSGCARRGSRAARGDGRLQFASSELSPSFPGYVEGAVVAGQDRGEEGCGSAAAYSVNGSLTRPSPPARRDRSRA